MSQESLHLPSPDVLRDAVETLARTGKRQVIPLGSKRIVLDLYDEKASSRRPRKKTFTKADPLWNIVGMLKADGDPTDVSDNVDQYLAEAYLDTHA
jgi:hypothetical protein